MLRSLHVGRHTASPQYLSLLLDLRKTPVHFRVETEAATKTRFRERRRTHSLQDARQTQKPVMLVLLFMEGTASRMFGGVVMMMVTSLSDVMPTFLVNASRTGERTGHQHTENENRSDM